jgi:hypothetical protein
MFERGELSGPIDDALAHCGPFIVVVISHHVLYVAMANSIFG